MTPAALSTTGGGAGYMRPMSRRVVRRAVRAVGEVPILRAAGQHVGDEIRMVEICPGVDDRYDHVGVAALEIPCRRRVHVGVVRPAMPLTT